MNVNDITEVPTDFSEKTRLQMIFERQHSLMEKYLPIEVSNGLCWTTACPVDIHDRFGQARLKDFFWRCTEELTEAREAFLIHKEIPEHGREELADAFHFLVEACLLAGFTHTTIISMPLEKLCDIFNNVLIQSRPIEEELWEVVYKLGCASNCLKNRPWKVDHKLVDEQKFQAYMKDAFFQMIRVFVVAGMDADAIFNMYYRKSEVNKFRQRSGY